MPPAEPFPDGDASRDQNGATNGRGALPFSVAIVGGGAFCTYALERLASEVAARPPGRGMNVHVFNRTSRFGAGMAQDWAQSTTSVMNRVASQIALAADESNSEARNLLPASARPTFLEWARKRHDEGGESRYELGPTDMPARHVHGEALRDAFERYVEILRQVSGVTVDLHAEEVREIRPAGGERFEVVGDRTGPVEADMLLLVTGHPDNAPAKGSRSEGFARFAADTPGIRYVDQIYPLHDHLTPLAVPAGETLGLVGMGLAAIDAILHLTEGRGGRFEAGNQGFLRYRRSGREPAVIVPTAPSGLFPGTRAFNMKAFDPTGSAHSQFEHKPLFATIQAIEKLRRTAGTGTSPGSGQAGQLDFQRHIFPLLVLEMGYVYYRTAAQGLGDLFEKAARPGWADFLERPGSAAAPSIDSLLEPLHEVAAGAGLPHFRWRALFDPVPVENAENAERWRTALLDHLRADIEAAERGNLVDPGKSACDGVWRDLRSVLSHAADFGGLTASSQRQFMRVYWRHYCRMSNGAGVEAMRKILALCENGIVDIAVGPDPEVLPDPAAGAFRIVGRATGAKRRVAVLAYARVHDFDAQADRSPVYRSLLKQGLVRLWRNPGAGGEEDFVPGSLDVTRDFEAVRADGSVEPRISIFGAPTEGTAFFQLAAARPQSNSSILNAFGLWARRVVEMAAAERPAFLLRSA